MFSQFTRLLALVRERLDRDVTAADADGVHELHISGVVPLEQRQGRPGRHIRGHMEDGEPDNPRACERELTHRVAVVHIRGCR